MPEITGRLRSPRLPDPPASPAKGELYYDTVQDTLYYWNGTAWQSAAGGGGVPLPAVENAFIKGSGGAAIWDNIVDTDLPYHDSVLVNNLTDDADFTTGSGDYELGWGFGGAASCLAKLWPTGTAGKLRSCQTNYTSTYGDSQNVRRGTRLTVRNDASGTIITIVHLDSAGPPYINYNPFSLRAGTNKTLAYGDIVDFIFDGDVWAEVSPSGGGGGGPPSGTAGGDLSGSYPDPSVVKAPRVQNPAAYTGGAALWLTQGAAQNILENYTTPGDSVARMRIQGTGLMRWGPGGAGALDVNLYRSASPLALMTDNMLIATSFANQGANAYGTTFPASPVNGQIFTLVDSTANPKYQWTFRYNVSSSSAYKWEFIGGSPFYSIAMTGQVWAGTASTWNYLTGNPSITVPRAGDYEVAWNCRVSIGTGPGAMVAGAGVSINSTSVIGVNSPNTVGSTAANSQFVACSGCGIILALSANDVLRMLNYQNTASTVPSYDTRALLVRPIRVS